MKYTAIGENHLYSKVYARGKKAVSRTVVVYCLRDYHAGRLQKAHPMKLRVNRIGLTATKKLGGAVTRNRVKRVLRAALQDVEKRTPLKTGFLIVIVARDAAVYAKSPLVARDLAYALRKLGLATDTERLSGNTNGEKPF